MARLIPNENTWVGFIPEGGTLLNYKAPTAAEVAGAVEVTSYLISLNASSRGNSVPTPALDSLFETSINGTSAATFDADFYRDDEDDDAWELFPRGTRGHFIISRFGGSGTDNLPIAGDDVEVWPVFVTSRTASNMTSNTAQTFTLSCAVNIEPEEDAVVAA
jgi:hypothetical protein